MRIGNFVPFTEVEGPELRAAVWFQGCSIRCPNCCNPHYFDPDGGELISPIELAEKIRILDVEGVTILGGEPFDQLNDLRELVSLLRADSDLGIILFTGHEWENVIHDAKMNEIVNLCDLIKCGPFVQEKSPDSRRWIGSTNQTVHFITERYRSLKNCWEKHRKEVEIHIDGETISVNGTPLAHPLLEILGVK